MARRAFSEWFRYSSSVLCNLRSKSPARPGNRCIIVVIHHENLVAFHTLARARVDVLRGNPDIWLDDLRRGTRLRLTTSADLDVMPVWSRDGREIAYRSGTVHETTIGFAASDGTGVTRTLACPQQPCEPSDWSPDGRYLVVTAGGSDIWTVPVERGATPQKLLGDL